MKTNLKNNALAVLSEILTPTFISLFLIIFLSVGAYYLTFVMMVQYSTDKFGASSSMAGLITGVVIVGALVGRFVSGEFVLRFGFLKPLAWSTALYALFTFLYLFANSSVALLLNRIAVGLTLGAISSIANAVIAVIAPKKHQASAIAYFSMSTALAVCIGPFLAISLTASVGAKGLFILCTAMAVICIGLLWPVKIPDDVSAHANHRLSISDCIELSVIPFCLVLALSSMAWANMPAFLEPYAQQNQVEAGASVFFVVYAIAMLISRPFTGAVCDRRGPKGVLLVSMGGLAIGLGCLWLGNGNFMVVLAGILTGFGFGNILSVGQAATVSLVKRTQYTQATSSFYIFLDLGAGIAPYVSGTLLPFLGYRGVFAMSMALVIIGMPLFLAVIRRSHD